MSVCFGSDATNAVNATNASKDTNSACQHCVNDKQGKVKPLLLNLKKIIAIYTTGTDYSIGEVGRKLCESKSQQNRFCIAISGLSRNRQ